MQYINKKLCYILTGGPGAGKTTVLNELAAHGYSCVPEVARHIIQEQVASGGQALPWADTIAYRDLMAERQIAAFVKIGNDASPVFFDRGIADIVSYSKLIAAPVSDELDEMVRRYRFNDTVLIFPPWEEIYTTDAERKQTFAEAIRTYEVLRETYRMYGYRTIDVPFGSVGERVDFILRNITPSS